MQRVSKFWVGISCELICDIPVWMHKCKCISFSALPLIYTHPPLPHPSNSARLLLNFTTKTSSCHPPAHTPHISPCCDNRWCPVPFPLCLPFTLSFSCLKYVGVQTVTFCLPFPLSWLSSCCKTGRKRREEEEEEVESKRASERKRRGGHGDGGMQRERFLSLPLFFVAITGPQKQERVVHLQVAAVSSFIGWLWMWGEDNGERGEVDDALERPCLFKARLTSYVFRVFGVSECGNMCAPKLHSFFYVHVLQDRSAYWMRLPHVYFCVFLLCVF